MQHICSRNSDWISESSKWDLTTFWNLLKIISLFSTLISKGFIRIFGSLMRVVIFLSLGRTLRGLREFVSYWKKIKKLISMCIFLKLHSLFSILPNQTNLSRSSTWKDCLLKKLMELSLASLSSTGMGFILRKDSFSSQKP